MLGLVVQVKLLNSELLQLRARTGNRPSHREHIRGADSHLGRDSAFFVNNHRGRRTARS